MTRLKKRSSSGGETTATDGMGRRSTRERGALALAGLGLLAAGCGSGATSGSTPIRGVAAPTYNFETDGPIVARVKLLAPAATDFFLQATIPVPPGTYAAGDVLVPLAVISSSDPTASPSQVEIVTRYPDASAGADVVEVISHVRRPDVPVGTPIEYDVVYHPHAAEPFELASEVRDLFDAPGSLVLRTEDVFGHRYRFDLLAEHRSGNVERVRNGALVVEHKTKGALLPEEAVPGNQGTLPHLMGVHAFVRTFDRQDFFALDLHFHNGFDGQDTTTPADDVLNELHFKRLSLRLPAGWRVIDTVPNPFFGSPVVANGMQTVDLVAPLADDKLHFMPRSSQFWRRLMVCRTEAAEAAARVHVERRNLAFCQPGMAPSGDELWSWWNSATARFLPQRHRLPLLDAIRNPEDVRGEHAGQLAYRMDQVRTGAAGGYPVEFGAQGWAHPWGVQYGGITGGEDIAQTVGHDIAWAASPDGYRYAELRARMHVDRQPVALYAADGEPTRFEDLLRPNGNHGPWFPVDFAMVQVGNQDFFGYQSAPMHQAAAAGAQGRLAPYKDTLAAFQFIDVAHYCRFLNNLLVLTWLGNDSLAKEQIEQSAELFRMTHHEAYTGNYGYISDGIMKRQLFVSQHPGTGIEYGRDQGWGLYTATASYAIGDDELRGRFRPWMRTIAHQVRAGQSTCSGNITSKRILNQLNGLYRSRQSFELAFMVNALQSMRRSVFEGVDGATQEVLDLSIIGAAYSTIQAPFWDPALGGQRRLIGVGLSDLSTPDFCSSIPFQALYNEVNTDNMTAMTPWAYAYGLTQDPIFLQRATEAFGPSANLLDQLEQHEQWLGHSAAFLALVQSLATP